MACIHKIGVQSLCPICPSVFLRRDVLRLHLIKTHRLKEITVCPQCLESAIDIVGHILKHHIAVEPIGDIH